MTRWRFNPSRRSHTSCSCGNCCLRWRSSCSWDSLSLLSYVSSIRLLHCSPSFILLSSFLRISSSSHLLHTFSPLINPPPSPSSVHSLPPFVSTPLRVELAPDIVSWLELPFLQLSFLLETLKGFSLYQFPLPPLYPLSLHPQLQLPLLYPLFLHSYLIFHLSRFILCLLLPSISFSF